MTATKRKPKPITAHPLFPVVTALWFATFFGLGSFAIAPTLLEGPVVALGIPALIPAAAPPLGFTARVMLALAMLIAGGAIGYMLGRKLGPRAAVAAPRKRAAGGFSRRNSESPASEAPRRPLNPAEDLDEPSLDAPSAEPAPFRRRSLSLSEDSQLHMPSELAPLPGGHLPWERETRSAQGSSEDPLALDLLLEDAQGLVEQAAVEQPAPAMPAPEPVVAETVNAPFAATPPATPEPAPAAAQPAPRQPAPLLQAPVADITPLERAPLESLGLVQMIERLALAISRRTAPRMDISALEESSFAQPAAAPVSVAPAAPVEPVMERLTAVEAQAKPETERVVRLRPAALHQVPPAEAAPSDQDEDAEVPGLDRFLRVDKASAAPADDQTPAEPEVAEDRYPSLLDMGPAPHRHEAVRIEDGLGLAELPQSDGEIEPVVVFPGQDSPLLGATRPFERPSILTVPGSPLAAPGRAAPSSPGEQLADANPAATPPVVADPEEADRALRAALATLQRMTAQG